MEAEFWIKAWTEGRTNFHQASYHEKMLQYFPQLSPQAGQSVLVPLCGKSKDMLWLQGLKLKVHGVELHGQAVEAFFEENKLSPLTKTQDEHYVQYASGDIAISCGDFFKLGKKEAYDFVYDRAALVALPKEMRKGYAGVVKKALKKGGKILLITYEYDQSKMDGPPFSIEDEEVKELFGDQFGIKLMETEETLKEGPRLAVLESLKQKVYILSTF